MDDNGQSEWANAHDAIDLLLQLYGKGQGYAAAKALANRAHGGLVKTRARLFKWEERGGGAYGNGKVAKEANWAELPKEFWWAEGGHAMTQNWVSGDFSTWIDKQYHWEAFGVEFARLDVEALLPAPRIERQASNNFPEHSEHEQVAAVSDAVPSDDAIEAKMLELIGLGMSRDVAAKAIRQVSGFEGVGNEHARRTVLGKLALGRPKKGA